MNALWPPGAIFLIPFQIFKPAFREEHLCNEAQAPTAEMAVTPPSIRKSAPTTYAESSDAR